MRLFLSVSALLLCASLVSAQSKDRDPGKEPPKPADNELVTKMMAFDKNKDGKLSKDEITDERLLKVFERADANKDGVVTKEELTKLAAQQPQNPGQGGPGQGTRPGQGGPGGPGGPRPQPGQILPEFLQDQLKLTEEQKKQLAAMQKDVDAKLEKLLTDDQRKMLKEIKERGPGGPGRPGEGGGRPGEGGGRPGTERP